MKFLEKKIEQYTSFLAVFTIIMMGDIERKGDLIRTLQIIKMRGTTHSRTKFAMNISSKNGIELAPLLKSRE